jgi:hypothetical protein
MFFSDKNVEESQSYYFLYYICANILFVFEI